MFSIKKSVQKMARGKMITVFGLFILSFVLLTTGERSKKYNPDAPLIRIKRLENSIDHESPVKPEPPENNHVLEPQRVDSDLKLGHTDSKHMWRNTDHRKKAMSTSASNWKKHQNKQHTQTDQKWSKALDDYKMTKKQTRRREKTKPRSASRKRMKAYEQYNRHFTHKKPLTRDAKNNDLHWWKSAHKKNQQEEAHRRKMSRIHRRMW